MVLLGGSSWLVLRLPERSPLGRAEKIRTALAAGLAILITGWISGRFIEGVGLTTLLASMGASAVILFAMPNSPVARPWPLVGGHFISALIGLGCARYLPDPWLSAALAVGVSVFAMHLARCLHPPGGASALIPILGGESIRALGMQFLLTPLAINVLLMLTASLAYRFLTRPSAPAQPARESGQPLPLERLGIRADDLSGALGEMNAFVDVSAGELSEIFEKAALRAYRREFGEITCAHIMTRDVVTIEFGDELESVWQLMHDRNLRALPVIDRGRHVIGMITLRDFFRHARAEEFGSLSGKLKKLLRATPQVTSDKPEVAGQIMAHPVITVRHDAHIAELASLLTRHGYHRIPIVDERDKLVGLVTQTDLIAAVYRLGGRAPALAGQS